MVCENSIRSPSIVENVEGSGHSESVSPLILKIISRTIEFGLQRENFCLVNVASKVCHDLGHIVL